MTKQTENKSIGSVGGGGSTNSANSHHHHHNSGVNTTPSSALTTTSNTAANGGSNNNNGTGGTTGNTTSCFPSVDRRDLCPNFDASAGVDDVIGDGDVKEGPFTHKSYNSAQDTIYLCNFRVSVDGDWLCLRQLDDVEVPMQRPTSYYETLPPSPEFVPFYGAHLHNSFILNSILNFILFYEEKQAHAF